ncbi:MAG TPA: hypothetical protein VNT27_08140 [Propionibacteriaceae bacterium]|nr:hypothetical protein [Propionibacteriaceae bacterium]
MEYLAISAEPGDVGDPSLNNGLLARSIRVVQDHDRRRSQSGLEDIKCRVPCGLTGRSGRPVDEQQINLGKIFKGVYVIPLELFSFYVQRAQFGQPDLGDVTNFVQIKK